MVVVLSITAFSQQQHKLTTKGDQAFEKGYWSAAIDNYKLALKKEKDSDVKLRIMYNLAQSYAGAKEYKNSVTWFKKVRTKGKIFLNDHPEVLLKLADAYKALERYTDAMAVYDAYSELKPEDEKGKKGSKSCELAIKWTDNPTRYKVENVRQLNSKFDDAIPVYSNKRYKEIVYQSYLINNFGYLTIYLYMDTLYLYLYLYLNLHQYLLSHPIYPNRKHYYQKVLHYLLYHI